MHVPQQSAVLPTAVANTQTHKHRWAPTPRPLTTQLGGPRSPSAQGTQRYRALQEVPSDHPMAMPVSPHVWPGSGHGDREALRVQQAGPGHGSGTKDSGVAPRLPEKQWPPEELALVGGPDGRHPDLPHLAQWEGPAPGSPPCHSLHTDTERPPSLAHPANQCCRAREPSFPSPNLHGLVCKVGAPTVLPCGAVGRRGDQ